MLKEKYDKVRNIINKVSFPKDIFDFSNINFALYDDTKVILNGKIFDKTNEFVGNTTIKYQKEQIAIFQVGDKNEDVQILASKIIHEMYHAFQIINHENRFPNEIEALKNYRYKIGNLKVKIKENYIIKDLLVRFNEEKYQRLLKYRKYREVNYPYEYKYEEMIEQIEGTANYFELEALRQISLDKYNKKLENIVSNIIDSQKLFPIRIISYDIGALLIKVLVENNIIKNMSFSNKCYLESINSKTKYERIIVLDDLHLRKYYKSFVNETKKQIKDGISKNNVVVSGNYELLGLNIYDATYYRNYAFSKHFVMYKDVDENKILYGNFIIKFSKNNRISKIYQTE